MDLQVLEDSFLKVEAHRFTVENFKRAMLRLDPKKHSKAIQFNLDDCLNKKALVYPLNDVRYYLNLAKEFDGLLNPETFNKLNFSLVKYLSHYNYHLKSPFKQASEEADFVKIVNILCEFYSAKFKGNKSCDEAFSRTLNLLGPMCDNLKDKFFNPGSLINFSLKLSQFEGILGEKKDGVKKMVEFIASKTDEFVPKLEKNDVSNLIELNKKFNFLKEEKLHELKKKKD